MQIGQTAIHVAALHGNVEAMAALLDMGADPDVENSRGSTPLHFAAAAKRRALEACRLLLDAGADDGLSDQMGQLPYQMAEDEEVR